MSKLRIEIAMNNDALLKDPIGEVMRMIKLGIRQTELQRDCTLYDINGQEVGKLEIIKDWKYNPEDFNRGELLNIVTMEDDKEQTIKNAKVIAVGDNDLRVETDEHFYYLEYKNLVRIKKL